MGLRTGHRDVCNRLSTRNQQELVSHVWTCAGWYTRAMSLSEKGPKGKARLEARGNFLSSHRIHILLLAFHASNLVITLGRSHLSMSPRATLPQQI